MRNFQLPLSFTILCYEKFSITTLSPPLGFPGGSVVKKTKERKKEKSNCQCRRHRFDPWVRKTTWEIPGTEEPGRLQSMGWQSVKRDCTAKHTCSIYNSKICRLITTSASYGCFVLFSKANKVLHLLDTRNRQ